MAATDPEAAIALRPNGGHAATWVHKTLRQIPVLKKNVLFTPTSGGTGGGCVSPWTLRLESPADYAVEDLVHGTGGFLCAAIQPPAQERQQAARQGRGARR